MTKHTIGNELLGVLVFVGAVWCVFLIGLVLPVNINAFGVTPRTATGILGIPLMPFLHQDLQHLTSNTVPLTILLMLLAGSKANSWSIVAFIVLIGGALLWLFGRSATHIGASGLVFGLMAFLLTSGFFERRIGPLIISVIVGFLYGGTLFSGVLPDLGSHVSWEGHLGGAIAGGLGAWLMTRGPARLSSDAREFSESDETLDLPS